MLNFFSIAVTITMSSLARLLRTMIKKNLLWFLGVLLVVLLIFSSCATANFIYRESTARKVVDLVNAKDTEILSLLSRNPFLLDGEIILMPGDMKMYWEKAFEAGFGLPGGVVESVVPVDGNTSEIFGDTMDIQVFFKKYVPAASSLAKVSSNSGCYWFVFNEKEGKYPKILAFKGAD